MTRYLLLAALAACVDAAVPAGGDDMILAETDVIANAPLGSDDASWITADTLHANAPLSDAVLAGERHIHSLWVSGSNNNRVGLTVSARASDGHDVRIAVLGPLVNGTREVLAADGYSSLKRAVSVSFDAATVGEHLVVVGSYNLASDSFYELHADCENCASRVDVLATPKAFGLVGDDHGGVQMLLGDMMLGYPTDIEVELWASPPMQWWNGTQVGTSVASGTQVNAIVPASVQAGDDVRLVVREAGGRILDSGIVTRYVPTPAAFARLDKILYGDIASLQIAGVVGFFEGVADLRLRSETHNREIARDLQHRTLPGQVGTGWSAFDATFSPDFAVAAIDGELLSVGYVDGNGSYRRLGCFEYCNNLSGMSSCTGGPRTCP